MEKYGSVWGFFLTKRGFMKKEKKCICQMSLCWKNTKYSKSGVLVTL